MSLETLFWPKRIAIIGASANPKTISGRPLEVLLQHHYSGEIAPVNPKYTEMRGFRCYPSIADVPKPVDVALIAVNAARVPALLRECAAAGVRNAVVFSSGFAEGDGSGAGLEDEIRAVAQGSDMRIMGPNSEGFFNALGPIPGGFSPTIDYERGLQKLYTGPAAIAAQSGGLGFALFNHGLQEGLGFSYVVSTGNEVDLESLDFVEYYLDDARVKVIALFVEGFRNPKRFLPLAARAQALGKPVVVAKVGRSSVGQRAAVSHTAHLAGTDAAYAAAFERYGVIRAEDQEELVDLAKGFAYCPLPQGNHVAILTTSGGTGVWMADACAGAGLQLPEIDQERQQSIRALIPSYGSTANPVDVTAQIIQSGGIAPPLRILTEAPYIDAVIVILTLASADQLIAEKEALTSIVRESHKPVLFYSYTTPSAESLDLLREIGAPSYTSTRRTATVLQALVAYQAKQSQLNPSTEDVTNSQVLSPSQSEAAARLLHSTASELCEYEAKAVLQAFGLPVPKGRLVQTEAEALAAAEEIGYPVVLKGQSPQIVHKSEAGFVQLGITSPEELLTAYRDLLAHVHEAYPQIEWRGVLIEEEVSGIQEMIVGMVDDPGFGPLMMVGSGGIYAEVLRDTAFTLAPVGNEEAAALIDKLRIRPLLEGMRGQPPADKAAFSDLVARFSKVALWAEGQLAEIDLNPVVVRPAGQGVCIVDAAMIRKA